MGIYGTSIHSKNKVVTLTVIATCHFGCSSQGLVTLIWYVGLLSVYLHTMHSWGKFLSSSHNHRHKSTNGLQLEL